MFSHVTEAWGTTSLEFGLWDHFERLPGIPIARQYEERIQLIVEAERLGFSRYHIAEHHLTPLDMAPSPTVFLSAVAQRTSRIRLGSMVFCLPLYHPVRLIQEICMLDQLSGGRFEPGVGRGVRDVEHEWFGLNPWEARERFDETLDLLLTGLAAGELDHHGKFYTFDHVPLDLTSLQQPMPVFWYAANLDAAGTHAMNGLGRAADSQGFQSFWQRWEQGREQGDPRYQRQPRVGSTRHILLADTDEEARRIARRAWTAYGNNFFTTAVRNLNRPGLDREHLIGDADHEMQSGARLLAGSPDTVRDALAASLEHLGPQHNYLAPAFQWGDMTHQEALHSLTLFATEVMPALARNTVGATASAS